MNYFQSNNMFSNSQHMVLDREGYSYSWCPVLLNGIFREAFKNRDSLSLTLANLSKALKACLTAFYDSIEEFQSLYCVKGRLSPLNDNNGRSYLSEMQQVVSINNNIWTVTWFLCWFKHFFKQI